MLTLKILQKFTKKTSIDELLMSKLKIRKQKFLIHYSTSRHQPQIRKGVGGKIHHSHHGFSSVFFVVKMKIDI